MRRRWVQWSAVLFVLGALGWRHQSEILGHAAGWYLRRVATGEAQTGDLTQRRAVVARTHRMLLAPPPPDALVPELFEVVTDLAQRGASGAMSLNWSAYVYSTYLQDMLRDRPTGAPARSHDQITAEIDRLVTFYSITKRPEAHGVRVSDLLGADGDTYSLEEIERAEREGRQLPLR